MTRRHIFTLILAALALPVFSQGNSEIYGVAFYNLENMFDTKHDFRKNDSEFLPGSRTDWTDEKYESKVKNMSRVLSELCTDSVCDGAAIIGLAEVENRNVLEDIISSPALAERGYEALHIEGPDERGIDCAFLYNPKYIRLMNLYLEPYRYDVPEDSAHLTRGFLVATVKMNDELCHFICCHLPSRGAESHARELGGMQVKLLKDKLQRKNPDAKIFIMGDMNDDPDNTSIAVSLGARKNAEEVEDGGLFNPWWAEFNPDGNGTLLYRGKWNQFDQIIVSKNLIERNEGSLYLAGHQIFRRDYLFQQEGKYKGSLLRTHAGGNWLNGYSDHLPVQIYLRH